MTATVLMISPGYPAEMPFFTRGLARAGARVIGAGDQPVMALPEMARDHLADYWQIPSFAHEDAILHEVAQRAAGLPSTPSHRCGNRRWCSPRASANASAFRG